jgi:phage tail protein X
MCDPACLARVAQGDLQDALCHRQFVHMPSFW